MRVALAALLILLFSLPAFADVDQHCLAACVSNGKSAGTDCLQQCSYNLPSKPVVAAPLTLESLEVHRSFPALMPATNDSLAKPVKPATPEKDPVCVSDCLKQGLQYDYCGEHCVKTTCQPGIVLCQKQKNPFVSPVIDK